MAQIKFTKQELRIQQVKLVQLEKYLPTLLLKKAMLQVEVMHCNIEIEKLKKAFSEAQKKVDEFTPLLSEKVACDVLSLAEVSHVRKEYENIAGVEVPTFKEVLFTDPPYSLFDTPIWTDSAKELVMQMYVIKEQMIVMQEKKNALEKELRDVSIRVNLFEKVLIPRTKDAIKKIKVFLGDLQLSEIAQAKVAKAKILAKGVHAL